MALVLNDRVKETSTTTGTGTLNLAGAETGFVTFVAGIATGNTTYLFLIVGILIGLLRKENSIENRYQ